MKGRITAGARRAYAIGALSAAALLFGACAPSGATEADVVTGLLGSSDFAKLRDLGYTDAQLENVAVCAADAAYPELSEQAREAAAKGDFGATISDAEYQLLVEKITDCAVAEVGAN